jgi:hypothetical protein
MARQNTIKFLEIWLKKIVVLGWSKLEIWGPRGGVAITDASRCSGRAGHMENIIKFFKSKYPFVRHEGKSASVVAATVILNLRR